MGYIAHKNYPHKGARECAYHRKFGGTQESSTRYIGVIMAANEWDNDLMDVTETARMLRVPTSWVYERTRRRGKERIPHIKLGEYLRFEIASVREWLNGQRAA
jgi:hypothetical protein